MHQIFLKARPIPPDSTPSYACGWTRDDQAELPRPSRGVSITHEPYACLSAWEKRGKVRDSDNVVYLARIISTMAGAEAEMELLGSQAIGDGHDRSRGSAR
jgi:hypothetical protein